tara:strand:+ start:4545 stop:5135 length:591 start_codon:yes stop_codon:yes gene_type:complete
MKFKGKEYTEVKDRLVAFRDEFPQNTIQTELLSVNNIVDSPTGDMCNEYVVKATIIPNPLAEPDVYYNGLAAERDNTGFVNKSSAIENCETSAVGRALAFAGYGGDYQFASATELENAVTKQKAVNPTIKSLEEMDKMMKACFESKLITEADRTRYNAQRNKGQFDTKIKVKKNTEYFQHLVNAMSKGVEDEKTSK